MLAEPPDDYGLLLKRLGELASRCITQALHPGIIIGLSWGTAVHSVVRAMPTVPLSDTTVPLSLAFGAVGHGDPLVDGAELGRWLAQKLHASFRFLSAPLLSSERVAKALRRERTIEETLAPRRASGSGDHRHWNAGARPLEPATRRLPDTCGATGARGPGRRRRRGRTPI